MPCLSLFAPTFGLGLFRAVTGVISQTGQSDRGNRRALSRLVCSQAVDDSVGTENAQVLMKRRDFLFDNVKLK